LFNSLCDSQLSIGSFPFNPNSVDERTPTHPTPDSTAEAETKRFTAVGQEGAGSSPDCLGA